MELQLSAGSDKNLFVPGGVCFNDRLPPVVCFPPLGGSLDDAFSAKVFKVCQHSFSIKAYNFPQICFSAFAVYHTCTGVI